MDKYEYKVRAEEIKALIAEGEFAEAVKIADTIDWRRVKSVMMLCTISDLYKINRRYQESKDILLLAYEKHPTGRLIVYSLCELSIKMEEYVQAIEYYKEFVQIAPKDTGRYILQYRLYEAQDVSLEERIAVLEEFKKRDYREKWAYELAYLYHRIGLTTKCVEECDEMFLWFGEGKYVLKALELKALHVPLNADQQLRYDTWIALRDAEIEEEKTEAEEMAAESENTEEPEGDTQTVSDIQRTEGEREIDPYMEEAPTTELPEVKTVDVGQYNTINLQMALAESMKEILAEEETAVQDENQPEESDLEQTRVFGADMLEEAGIPAEEPMTEAAVAVEEESEEPDEPEEIKDETEDEENEIEEDLEESKEPSITEQLIAPLLQETVEMPKIELPQDTDELQEIGGKIVQPTVFQEKAKEPVVSETVPMAEPKPDLSAGIPGARTGVLTPLNVKPTKYDDVLSQEYDGQISLAIPDETAVEKQITGQLSIEDIMAEWEEMKRTNEQKRMEDVRKRILEHTGSLFADFDEATKTGLLEELEKAFVAAIMKESEKPPIKKVILPDEAEKELETAAHTPSHPQAAVKITSMTNLPSAEKKVVPEPAMDEAVTAEDEVEELEEIEETNIPENVIAEEVMTAEESPDEAVEETLEQEEDTIVEETEVSKQEEAEPEKADEENASDSRQSVRELTEEEKELFGQFVHHKKSREQLVHTLDNMSLAACTGNVIITGEEDGSTINLAKGLIREMQYNDSNFSGKVAKVSGAVLNKKDVAETFAKLSNGALIIEKASDLKAETATKIAKVLEKDNMGLILILEDRKQKMNQLLSKNAVLKNAINLRVDIEPLDDEALVAYAKQYAEDMEYSIDEFGVLALHTRIADMQTSDHEVTLAEVRELVDEAIYYANKKTPKHFVDILLAKRYDEEDMIILREKDFMHY